MTEKSSDILQKVINQGTPGADGSFYKTQGFEFSNRATMLKSFSDIRLSTVSESDVPDFKEPVHFSNDQFLTLVKSLEMSTSATEKAKIIAQSIEQQKVAARQHTQEGVAALNTDIALNQSQVGSVGAERQGNGVTKAASALENIKDPQEAVKVINTYVSKYVDKANSTAPGSKEGALTDVLIQSVLRNGRYIDMVTGSVYNANNELDTSITTALKKIPKEDINFALNLFILREYQGNSTVIDNKKVQETICAKYNITLTNVPSQNVTTITNSHLLEAEKSWLLSYVRDPKSIQVSEEKSAELAPAVARAKAEQTAARAEAERISKLPMTAEDWRDPAAAIGKLVDKGGALLLIPGALWLIFSCFGFDTMGEKGAFFMKLLAGAAGIGAAKATGAIDMAVDAIQKKPGTTGGAAGEAIADTIGSVWGRLKVWAGEAGSGIETAILKYWTFKDYTFEYENPNGGKSQKNILEYPAGALLSRLNDNSTTTDVNKKLKPQKNGASSNMDEALQNSLKTTINELHNEVKTKWLTENPGKAEVEFNTFFNKPTNTVESLIKYVHAPKTGATPQGHDSHDTAPAIDFKSAIKEQMKEYKDNWFVIKGTTTPIKKNGLEVAINTSADVGALKTKAQKWEVNPFLVSPEKEKAESILQSLQS